MSFSRTEFRLKTEVASVLIDEPNVLVSATIAEPVKWSDIALIGEVDELFHGFNYNYAKGNISLQFTCESAASVIRKQYDRYGVDAFVQFLVVAIDREDNEEIEYDGKIRFQEGYKEEKGFAYATVSLNSIHEKVTSRWDTKIELTANRTLDDVAILPPSEVELPLVGQTLHEKGQTFIQKKRFESVVFPNPGLGGVYYTTPNMLPIKETSATPNTTTTVIPALETLKGTSLLYGSVTTIKPLGNNPLLTVDNSNAGDYHIEIDWDFVANVILTKLGTQIGKAKFARLIFTPVVVIRIPGKDDEIVQLASPVDSSGYTVSVEQGFSCRFSKDYQLPVGSQVFAFCEIISFSLKETKQQEITITTTNVRVLIDRKTNAAASRAKAFGYAEALRHVLGCITSVIDPNTGTGLVTGEILDAASVNQALDGYMREYAISSGNQIRGLSKPVSASAKDLLLFGSAQHVIGMLYEKDVDTGVESIRIEQGEWFYRGDEILRIDEIYSYNEAPDVDFLMRKIEVGYEKYPTEGPGVNEEFNTERTYQTPLINSENTLEIKSPLIAAGTAIEIQRRLGAKKLVDGVEVSSELDAGAYDDDLFVFHVTNQVFTDTVKFIVEPPTTQKPYLGNYIQFSPSIINRLGKGTAIKKDDVIELSGTPYDGSYIVLEVVVSTRFGRNPTYRVFFQGFTNLGPVPCTWQIAGQPFKAKGSERLNVVGLTDPANTPNQELSPARMLRRWGPFICSALFHKPLKEQLKCTEYKGNGSMMTQVKDTVLPLPGDPYRQPVYETKDTAIGELQKGNRLFKPDLIYVKCKMTRAQQKALFDALKNKGPEEKRMGFLSFKRPYDGVIVSGYLRSIEYKKSEQTATMVLRKRRLELDIPTCEYYFDWRLQRFPTDPTADPNRYLFCQFKQLKPV